METTSSAKSLISLFWSSNLQTFSPDPSRNLFQMPASASPTTVDDPSPDLEIPRKRRRRNKDIGEWTCAEIRAVESFRKLKTGSELDDELRDLLLPNRTKQEVLLQLARVEKTVRERRSKLHELQTQENAELAEMEKDRAEKLEEDNNRRRKEMDIILGLAHTRRKVADDDHKSDLQPVNRGKNTIKASLDQALGLVEESKEQRRKREIDEALGLNWK